MDEKVQKLSYLMQENWKVTSFLDSNVLLFNLSAALVPWNIVNCLHKVFIFSLLFPKAC